MKERGIDSGSMHKNVQPEPVNYHIKITRDEPYIVSGGPPLSEQIIRHDPNGECLE